MFPDVAGPRTGNRGNRLMPSKTNMFGGKKMKQEKIVRYEKPALSKYGFLGVAEGAYEGGLSQGGDITEGCDSDFDE